MRCPGWPRSIPGTQAPRVPCWSTVAWAPRVVQGKESTLQQSKRLGRCGFSPWAGKVPWRGAWHPTSRILALENPMDRGAWRATVHGVSKESDTAQRPSPAQCNLSHRKNTKAWACVQGRVTPLCRWSIKGPRKQLLRKLKQMRKIISREGQTS